MCNSDVYNSKKKVLTKLMNSLVVKHKFRLLNSEGLNMTQANFLPKRRLQGQNWHFKNMTQLHLAVEMVLALNNS